MTEPQMRAFYRAFWRVGRQAFVPLTMAEGDRATDGLFSRFAQDQARRGMARYNRDQNAFALTPQGQKVARHFIAGARGSVTGTPRRISAGNT